nr:MAG TPA: hypothetical protein [Caudoviricetes sp.]
MCMHTLTPFVFECKSLYKILRCVVLFKSDRKVFILGRAYRFFLGYLF